MCDPGDAGWLVTDAHSSVSGTRLPTPRGEKLGAQADPLRLEAATCPPPPPAAGRPVEPREPRPVGAEGWAGDGGQPLVPPETQTQAAEPRPQGTGDGRLSVT